MAAVLNYILRDLFRSRFVVGYAMFFVAIAEVIIRLVGTDRAVLALLELSIPLVPLVTLTFAIVYLYDAQRMAEMLLAQPLARGRLTLSLYSGLLLVTCLVPVVSIGLPFLVRGHMTISVWLLIAAVAVLSIVFTSISFAIVSAVRHRLQGLATGIMIWLLLLIVYDGVLLLGLHVFADYPLERAVIAAVFLNPIDLCRTLVLLHTDTGAMMGYTGAVFQQFLGSRAGISLGLLVLAAWVVMPFHFSYRRFARKDY